MHGMSTAASRRMAAEAAAKDGSGLAMDPDADSLDRIRRYFAEQDPDRFIDRLMELAGVETITMTNEVFDDNERSRWLADPGIGADPRFCAVLRLDRMILDWPAAAASLREWGYECIFVELDEFLKAGGSAKCLTLRLDGEEAAEWK